MAPAPKPQVEPSSVEPEEARESGGSLAEANPPHDPAEYILVTVDRSGTVKAHSYESLNEVAEKIMEDIEEVLTPELLYQLPFSEGYWEAVDIVEDNKIKMYTVIKKWNKWEAVYKIPFNNATLYVAHDEILGTMGPKLYVRGKALLTKKMAFYKIQILRTQISDLVSELMIMMGDSP